MRKLLESYPSSSTLITLLGKSGHFYVVCSDRLTISALQLEIQLSCKWGGVPLNRFNLTTFYARSKPGHRGLFHSVIWCARGLLLFVFSIAFFLIIKDIVQIRLVIVSFKFIRTIFTMVNILSILTCKQYYERKGKLWWPTIPHMILVVFSYPYNPHLRSKVTSPFYLTNWWILIDWFLVFNATFSNIMATSFSGGVANMLRGALEG
jgi:hypothetical protein